MRRSAIAPAPFVPMLWLAARPLGVRALSVVIGSFLLALASRIEVPLIPVPMNMQTFAIVMIGALYGWRLGAATVLLWLTEGTLGLPVFSGGAAGIGYFLGPTAGYLFSFPFLAAFIGWLVEKKKIVTSVWSLGFAMLVGHAFCVTAGAAWLAYLIGAEKAWLFGVAPFILGSVLKSGLAALTVETVRNVTAKRS